MISLEKLEKGLVCLVPKKEAVSENSMLLTCHEYSVCDCTVLKLIQSLKIAREVLQSTAEDLHYVSAPVSALEALSKIDALIGGDNES